MRDCSWLEGLDDIFVGKYLLQLPSEEEIKRYLIENMPTPEALEEDVIVKDGE